MSQNNKWRLGHLSELTYTQLGDGRVSCYKTINHCLRACMYRVSGTLSTWCGNNGHEVAATHRLIICVAPNRV